MLRYFRLTRNFAIFFSLTVISCSSRNISAFEIFPFFVNQSSSMFEVFIGQYLVLGRNHPQQQHGRYLNNNSYGGHQSQRGDNSRRGGHQHSKEHEPIVKGLMSQKEMEWIFKVQMMQLKMNDFHVSTLV